VTCKVFYLFHDFSVMPLLQLKTNLKELPEHISSEFQKLGGEVLSEELGKSIKYVMVLVESSVSISFSGDSESPCAYLEVKNVGNLSPPVTEKISGRLSGLCAEMLAIEEARVYIEFQQSDRHMWGWNGTTFG